MSKTIEISLKAVKKNTPGFNQHIKEINAFQKQIDSQRKKGKPIKLQPKKEVYEEDVKEIDLSNQHNSNLLFKEAKVKQTPPPPGTYKGYVINKNLSSKPCNSCEECGVANAPKRYVTQNFLCEECRRIHPHKLITQETCMNEYGLDFETLTMASRQKQLRKLVSPNYKDRHASPFIFYFEHEILEFLEKQ